MRIYARRFRHETIYKKIFAVRHHAQVVSGKDQGVLLKTNIFSISRVPSRPSPPKILISSLVRLFIRTILQISTITPAGFSFPPASTGSHDHRQRHHPGAWDLSRLSPLAYFPHHLHLLLHLLGRFGRMAEFYAIKGAFGDISRQINAMNRTNVYVISPSQYKKTSLANSNKENSALYGENLRMGQGRCHTRKYFLETLPIR